MQKDQANGIQFKVIIKLWSLLYPAAQFHTLYLCISIIGYSDIYFLFVTQRPKRDHNGKQVKKLYYYEMLLKKMADLFGDTFLPIRKEKKLHQLQQKEGMARSIRIQYCWSELMAQTMFITISEPTSLEPYKKKLIVSLV